MKLSEMKPIYILSILLLVIAAGCSNEAEENEGALSRQELEIEKEKIRATLTEMWDAVEKGDLDRYASYVHPDFTQFGEYDSALLIGKDAEIAGMKKSMAKSKDMQTEMIAPRITIKGNVAWIVYYWDDHGLSNGVPFASHGKSTRIFLKEEGKWLCVHGHYTLLPFER